jgi:hypothetical protein
MLIILILIINKKIKIIILKENKTKIKKIFKFKTIKKIEMQII